MFYKKISLLTLSFLIASMSLTGCGTAEAGNTNTVSEKSISSKPDNSTAQEEIKSEEITSSEDKSLNIVCTIFPEYDWVTEILGSHAENDNITYLLDNGTDLHSYQPTAKDMTEIAQCDLFIYVGGESDEWVEDALAEAVNPDMQVINLMEVMGDSAKLEELKEGMQEGEHEHSHEHNTTFEDDEVKDRELSEWNGSWQSTYPLLLDGSLDEVWEHKAEDDDSMTAEDYKNKYTNAYETDVVTIEINAPEITYITEDGQITAKYSYSGYYIRTKDDGSKQVRYKFEKSGGDDSAMQYIVFSDHNIEPSEPEHFHLYSGNDGFDALVEEGTHFPTYYPASLSAEDIVNEMTGGETTHSHDHSKEVSTFEDDEVQDRSLSDWAGEWQSGYPLALDGSLDDAFAHKAESGSMTAQEYKDYYIKGYETDYDTIKIEDNHITFTKNDGTVTESDYEYTGYFIQDWSTGTRAAMYRFEAVDKESGAPVYIEFNDHIIEPEKAEHFHIRMSNESYEAIEDPENRWPTFYPAELSPEEVCEELAGHGSHDEEEEYDEHVWLSLKNAKLLCAEITDKLCTLDSGNAEDYKANLKSYAEQLDKLDSDFQTLVDSASVKTLVFGDRFPFRYFVDDYGLDYYAAFIGCSSETEASFETIVFLSQKLDELGTDTIFTIENSDKSIAQAVINSTTAKNQNIAELNSIQSVSSQQIADGVNYLSLMQKNYDVLKETLK